MSRLALFAVAALACAGAAHAQRVEVDPSRWTLSKPVYVHPGELVAGEISPVDVISGVERSGDVLTFQARAGEIVTAQVRSDVPSLLVAVRSARPGMRLSPLLEGAARDAPIRFVAPKDGEYQIFVHTVGPNRYGKYLLSIGTDQGAPPFDPPKPPPPVQVAEVPKGPGAAAQPRPAPAAPSKPAASAALPKLTPPPGVLAAEVGKTVARPAGKAGAKVDLYAFVGEAGSILTATASGAKGYGVTIYTPEGDEMLTSSGLGAAKLSAVLPRDAVYVLAVTRQDGTKPYRLSLAAEAPDIFQWSMRSWAGYETLRADGSLQFWTCWTAPGSALRYNFPNGQVSTLVLHAGGDGRWDYAVATDSYAFTTRMDGARFIRTRVGTVRTQTWSLDDPPRPHGAYRGYLCD